MTVSNAIVQHRPRHAGYHLNTWDAMIEEEAKRPVSLRGPVILAAVTLFIGAGGFVLWAAQTTLSQAAFASGHVIVESKTKTVSHLEGGTLQALLVSEGEKVKQGQFLAILDATRSMADLTLLSQQLYSFRVRHARLVAERDGKTSFSAPDPGDFTVSDDFAARVVANETRYMTDRERLRDDQFSVDGSLVEQATKQLESLDARLASLKDQFDIADADFKTIQDLSNKKLATRAQLSKAKYDVSELTSQILQTEAQLSETRERQKQIELNRISRESERLRQIAEDLQGAELDIAKLTQSAVMARDIVEKSVVRAPQEGYVGNIKVVTPGSAVIPGAPLLDIVPVDQPLIVEGVARAADIETLRVGHKAEIRLDAFSAAEALPLIGEITYLAPDSKVDEKTGETTYAIKARISEDELKKQPNIFLHPGMTAQISVVGGSRTALDYLLMPIERSFNRAFREK